jgi:hypothetical protein
MARFPVRNTSAQAKPCIGFQPFLRARIATVSINVAASSSPGTTPARNRAPSEVPVTAEYRIIGELGGIRMPIPDEVAERAAANGPG